MRTLPNPSPISAILATFDDALMSAWEQHSYTWAINAINVYENTGGKDASRAALELAEAACRGARTEPNSPYPLPRWFGPRVRHALGHDNLHRYRWYDHAGVVKLNGTRCFISEPYPWFHPPEDPKHSAAAKWRHVIGDYAAQIPAAAEHMADAATLAKVIGAKLLIERVAWHHPWCFRMTFVPLNPKLSIKAAIKLYNPGGSRV